MAEHHQRCLVVGQNCLILPLSRDPSAVDHQAGAGEPPAGFIEALGAKPLKYLLKIFQRPDDPIRVRQLTSQALGKAIFCPKIIIPRATAQLLYDAARCAPYRLR